MTPFPLQELRDIHAPPPPGISPLEWALLALALLALPLFAWLIRCWRRNAPRRQAWRALRALEQLPAQDPTWVAQLNRWLKQSALLYYPKEQVAQLHGQAWLAFLDAHSPAHSPGGFSQFTALWNGWVYDQQPISVQQQTALITQARAWFKQQSRRRMC